HCCLSRNKDQLGVALRGQRSRQTATDKAAEGVKIAEDLAGAPQEPAADLFHRHATNHVDRNPQAMGQSQFALRSRAPAGIPVPVTYNGIATMLDQIQIVRDDLAHRLLKSR